MKQNIKVAKELIKLAKSLVASSEAELFNVLSTLIKNPDAGAIRYQLPSGRWLTFEYDEEENGTIKCYSPAVTSDYAILNEPWGFWFFGAEELGQLYNDSSENDYKIMARDIIQLDKDYRFDKNDEEKILEFIKKLYFNNYEMSIIEDVFDEFIDVVNENLASMKMDDAFRNAFYDMENKYNNDDFDE